MPKYWVISWPSNPEAEKVRKMILDTREVQRKLEADFSAYVDRLLGRSQEPSDK